jgi:hypothetical protein
MTSLQRCIRKLEAPNAVREVVAPGWVAVMRERQRRRAEAEGLPYVVPVREPLVLANGRYTLVRLDGTRGGMTDEEMEKFVESLPVEMIYSSAFSPRPTGNS